MGNLVSRAFKMSNDVYAAMMARGFTGEVRVYDAFRMTPRDWLVLAGALLVASTAVVAGRFI